MDIPSVISNKHLRVLHRTGLFRVHFLPLPWEFLDLEPFAGLGEEFRRPDRA